MNEKVLLEIRKLSVLIGFFLILGTFGAADLNRISLGAFVVQLVIGSALTLFGLVGLPADNEEYPY